MFLADTCSSTTNSSYTKSNWTLVSYHSDDVITISASTCADLDLDDDFSKLSAEEILQLVENIKHTYTRHTRSFTAIQQ